MRGGPVCALCGNEAVGFALADGKRLCHTEEPAKDCYHLWTVYGARPTENHEPVVHLVPDVGPNREAP